MNLKEQEDEGKSEFLENVKKLTMIILGIFFDESEKRELLTHV